MGKIRFLSGERNDVCRLTYLAAKHVEECPICQSDLRHGEIIWFADLGRSLTGKDRGLEPHVPNPIGRKIYRAVRLQSGWLIERAYGRRPITRHAAPADYLRLARYLERHVEICPACSHDLLNERHGVWYEEKEGYVSRVLDPAFNPVFGILPPPEDWEEYREEDRYHPSISYWVLTAHVRNALLRYYRWED